MGTAAKQGDSSAAYNAGVVCEDADGIAGAWHWYGIAAQMGDKDALAWLVSRRGAGEKPP